MSFRFLLLLMILSGCTKPKYYYLDKSNIYKFKTGDTLLYKSILSSDTFIVQYIYNGGSSNDKVLFIESLDVDVKLLSKRSYISGYHINYNGKNGIYLGLDNFKSPPSDKWSSPDSYKLGNTIIDDVYRIETTTEIKTIYFSRKYGILAYELAGGEIMTLEERLIIGK